MLFNSPLHAQGNEFQPRGLPAHVFPGPSTFAQNTVSPLATRVPIGLAGFAVQPAAGFVPRSYSLAVRGDFGSIPAMPPPIGTPTLCRLCRRPIIRAAKTCPSCGARQSWSKRARGSDSRSSWRTWRIALGATLLVVLVVGAIIWLGVLREIKAGVSSNGTPGSGRPSPAECAELAGELTKRAASSQPLAAEVRDRIRECFGRR